MRPGVGITLTLLDLDSAPDVSDAVRPTGRSRPRRSRHESQLARVVLILRTSLRARQAGDNSDATELELSYRGALNTLLGDLAGDPRWAGASADGAWETRSRPPALQRDLVLLREAIAATSARDRGLRVRFADAVRELPTIETVVTLDFASPGLRCQLIDDQDTAIALVGMTGARPGWNPSWDPQDPLAATAASALALAIASASDYCSLYEVPSVLEDADPDRVASFMASRRDEQHDRLVRVVTATHALAMELYATETEIPDFGPAAAAFARTIGDSDSWSPRGDQKAWGLPPAGFRLTFEAFLVGYLGEDAEIDTKALLPVIRWFTRASRDELRRAAAALYGDTPAQVVDAAVKIAYTLGRATAIHELRDAWYWPWAPSGE